MLPVSDSVPRRGRPIATSGLILANALVFLLELSLPPRELETFLHLFGVVPARFTRPDWARQVGFPPGGWWAFLTSMYVHGGWLHVLTNMWTLWIFGDNVEDRMGTRRFLAFYTLCGLAAGGVHVWSDPESVLPTVGASGAIAGVLGAYFLLFPTARVVVLVPVLFYPLFFELPALFYLGFWFLLQFYSGTLSLAVEQSTGGVAWWAHVGGFAAGALTVWAFLRPRAARRRLQDDEWWQDGQDWSRNW